MLPVIISSCAGLLAYAIIGKTQDRQRRRDPMMRTVDAAIPALADGQRIFGAFAAGGLALAASLYFFSI